MSEPIWVTSKWSKAELEGKTIKFAFTTPKGHFNGVGRLLVSEQEGKLWIQIEIALGDKTHDTKRRLSLSQQAANVLQRDGEDADFICYL